jgi:hypothetical protein
MNRLEILLKILLRSTASLHWNSLHIDVQVYFQFAAALIPPGSGGLGTCSRSDPAESETLKPIIADSKSGQFKVRTPLSENLTSDHFLGVCQEI